MSPVDTPADWRDEDRQRVRESTPPFDLCCARMYFRLGACEVWAPSGEVPRCQCRRRTETLSLICSLQTQRRIIIFSIGDHAQRHVVRVPPGTTRNLEVQAAARQQRRLARANRRRDQAKEASGQPACAFLCLLLSTEGTCAAALGVGSGHLAPPGAHSRLSPRTTCRSCWSGIAAVRSRCPRTASSLARAGALRRPASLAHPHPRRRTPPEERRRKAREGS